MIRRSVGTLRPPSPRRLRPARRRWPLLLLAVPVAAWAGLRLADDSSPTEALSPSTAASAPGSTLVAFDAPVGSRITDARCWMVVIDESSSMATADEVGSRADAVRAAGEFLAAYGLAGDRIGVTWFADSADVTPPAVASGTPATRANSLSLGSGTDIANALNTTLDSMDTSCGAAQRVVVLVSDGQLSSDAEFRATADLITGAGRNVHLHLIAMNGNQAFEAPRPFWEDPALGIDSITTVSSLGSDEVAAAVAGILTLETGQQVAAK